MKRPHRPGILATRAVNQYRRKDVLTFLGLRYYLANSASRSDAWIKHVSTDLAVSRSAPYYFSAQNFKERGDDGQIEHRALHLPGANEALAETALLTECSRHPKAFDISDCVFSYKLSDEKDRSGVFENYVKGLRRRHEAVEDAAFKCAGGIVQYVDIQKFYPSIKEDLALTSWRTACSKANFPQHLVRLGEKLTSDHCAIHPKGTGLLTGPMFSHLLANLVLKDFDAEMSRALSARYFRYVDDIMLVGKESDVDESLRVVEAALQELGFILHPHGSEKRLRVAVHEWLEGAHDFKDATFKNSWPAFVYNLKRYLLLQKGDIESLQACFVNAGFRIPLTDYSAIAYEAGWVESVKEWAARHWFRASAQSITSDTLLEQAFKLRDHHISGFENYLSQIKNTSGYTRKRLVPKLRYAASRLIYLADSDALANMGRDLLAVNELHLHAKVMTSIACRKIDELLVLGDNAAQAAAQALVAAEGKSTLTATQLTTTERQSLAILLMNGVPVESPHIELNDGSELMRLAIHGCDRQLMKSKDLFIQELSCLHGLSSFPRHSEMFRTAFDQDDEIVMDAIDQLQEYASA